MEINSANKSSTMELCVDIICGASIPLRQLKSIINHADCFDSEAEMKIDIDEAITLTNEIMTMLNQAKALAGIL